MRKLLLRAVVIATMPLIAPAFAAGIPDPVAGKKFAEVECGRCHVVDPLPGKAPPERIPGAAAPFKTMAFDPEMTVDKIRDSLRLPHGAMANVLVAEKDIDNIISYIVALRTQEPALVVPRQ